MNVLMVTPLLPHPDAVTGGELVKYGQLRALARHHEVTLATFARADPGERAAVRRLQEEGIRVYTVLRSDAGGVRRRARLAARWVRSAWPMRALAFADPAMQRVIDGLVGHGVDLIQVEDHAMGTYRYPASVPAVLTEHDAVAGDAPAAALRGAEARRWARHLPEVWRRFDRVQVFSARDARVIGARAPDVVGRVSVNPFGIDVPPPADPRAERPDTVVFVGGFLHEPNVDAAEWVVREVMPRLRRQRPGVRLALVGSHPPRRVRALAAEDVVVTGRVPAVEPYVDGAAVVLAPVRAGGGMRVKVLQALARGKAVVTTGLGAEGLAVGGAEPPLRIAEDAGGVARAAADLLSDPAARRALGGRARAFVAANHSWDAYSERLEAVYASVRAGRLGGDR